MDKSPGLRIRTWDTGRVLLGRGFPSHSLRGGPVSSTSLSPPLALTERGSSERGSSSAGTGVGSGGAAIARSSSAPTAPVARVDRRARGRGLSRRGEGRAARTPAPRTRQAHRFISPRGAKLAAGRKKGNGG